jgi:hypothetical protein
VDPHRLLVVGVWVGMRLWRPMRRAAVVCGSSSCHQGLDPVSIMKKVRYGVR